MPVPVAPATACLTLEVMPASGDFVDGEVCVEADEFPAPAPPAGRPGRSASDRLSVIGCGLPEAQSPARKPAHADDMPSDWAVAVSVTRLAPVGKALRRADPNGLLGSALSRALSPRDALCGLDPSVAVTVLPGTGTGLPPDGNAARGGCRRRVIRSAGGRRAGGAGRNRHRGAHGDTDTNETETRCFTHIPTPPSSHS